MNAQKLFKKKQEGCLFLPAVGVCEWNSCKLQKTKLAVNGPPSAEKKKIAQPRFKLEEDIIMQLAAVLRGNPLFVPDRGSVLRS